AMPASSAARAVFSSSATDGILPSIRSRSGKFFANSLASARPAYLSSGAARAIATARSASAAVPASDMSLAEIVALAAFGFFDRAVAHLDADRHAAHRDRIGGVGACRARRLHQPLGAGEEGGLVEQRGGGEHGASL